MGNFAQTTGAMTLRDYEDNYEDTKVSIEI
jgi:hypothetical protein